MIPDEAAKYLWDARGAAERVARFTRGRGYQDYLADDLLRSAVDGSSRSALLGQLIRLLDET